MPIRRNVKSVPGRRQAPDAVRGKEMEMNNKCFRVQDAVRALYALCDETGTELLHIDAVTKVLEDLQPAQAETINQASLMPAGFIYEIRDKATGGLLMSAGIFRTEEDAREQARMEAALHNIEGCFIRTAPAASLWPGWGV